MTLKVNAYSWHKKPDGFDGPCPVCEFPGKKLQHHAVRDSEGIVATAIDSLPQPWGGTTI
jgi:hypothetical protein